MIKHYIYIIQGTKNIKEAIDKIAVNNLVGVYCPTCNKNTNAKDRVSFISLPSTLIVCIRRFAYNQRTKQASRLNDKLELSSKLTIETATVSLHVVGKLVTGLCLEYEEEL